MANYEYKCINQKCNEYNKLKIASIPMNEYSEEKLPKCECCKDKTARNYTANPHATFGDGYKS